jgi:hypothetical protein
MRRTEKLVELFSLCKDTRGSKQMRVFAMNKIIDTQVEFIISVSHQDLSQDLRRFGDQYPPEHYPLNYRKSRHSQLRSRGIIGSIRCGRLISYATQSF